MWHWRHACIFTCHLICLGHSCISSNHIFHCTPLRSRTLSQKGATPLHPSSSAPQHSPPIVSCSLRPIWDPTMDRSAKELFLNFMIVLITVLLMWLLVKTYQDWTMEQQQKRDEREAEETESGGKAAWLLQDFVADWFVFRHSVYIFSFFYCVVTGLIQSSSILLRSKKHVIATAGWACCQWRMSPYLYSEMFFECGLEFLARAIGELTVEMGGWIK